MYKKCDDCGLSKGERAFEKGKKVCKMCIQDAEEKNFKENGVITKKKCFGCGTPKNKFTEFSRQANGIIKGKCRSCDRLYNFSRSKSYKVHENLGFEFEGNRWCIECDEPKNKDKFLNTKHNKRRYATCEDCREKKVVTMGHAVKCSTESQIKKRELRVKRKKEARKSFIERFNKEQGVA